MYILDLALKTTRELYSRIHRHASNGTIVLSFSMRRVIADIIAHAKIFVNRFMDFGVLTPRNFAWLDDLATA